MEAKISEYSAREIKFFVNLIEAEEKRLGREIRSIEIEIAPHGKWSFNVVIREPGDSRFCLIEYFVPIKNDGVCEPYELEWTRKGYLLDD